MARPPLTALALILSATAWAHFTFDRTVAAPVEAGGAKPKAKAQEYCPVMTALPVDEDGKVVTYRGVKVYLCCDTCVRKWRADPGAYLSRAYLPQLAGVELPARGLAQVYCPVYRDRVVSAKDPHVLYRGVKVYLFNKAAVKKWQADPEKFADVKLLPQLAGAVTPAAPAGSAGRRSTDRPG